MNFCTKSTGFLNSNLKKYRNLRQNLFNNKKKTGLSFINLYHNSWISVVPYLCANFTLIQYWLTTVFTLSRFLFKFSNRNPFSDSSHKTWSMSTETFRLQVIRQFQRKLWYKPAALQQKKKITRYEIVREICVSHEWMITVLCSISHTT